MGMAMEVVMREELGRDAITAVGETSWMWI